MPMTHVPDYEPCGEVEAREYGGYFLRSTNSASGTTLHIDHPDATRDDPSPLCGDDRPDEWIPKDMYVYPEGSKDICRVCRKVIARKLDGCNYPDCSGEIVRQSENGSGGAYHQCYSCSGIQEYVW